ncbi:unnamed protein product [Brachionus calyciflorus]|uniref:Uncharacterized protein n=1 Tax=Brachionus calyciflorus TaxID=104777 RepID=A0A813YQ42_9BILA|nr:unnamed protein product [Brachionus calyciflorus]
MDMTSSISKSRCPKIIHSNIEIKPNNLYTVPSVKTEEKLDMSKLNKKAPYKTYGPSKNYGNNVLTEVSKQYKINI